MILFTESKVSIRVIGGISMVVDLVIRKGIFIKYNGDDMIFMVPEGIKEIADGAFANCKSIKEIIISDSVKRIGVGAFYNCKALESIKMPNSIEQIGEDAFGGCTSLSSISLPNNIWFIGKRAFERCEMLKEIQIPYSVKRIGFGTFRGCISIERVCILRGDCVVDKTAFVDCISLKKITIGEKTFCSPNLNMRDSLDNGGTPVKKCIERKGKYMLLNFKENEYLFRLVYKRCNITGWKILIDTTIQSEIKSICNAFNLARVRADQGTVFDSGEHIILYGDNAMELKFRKQYCDDFEVLNRVISELGNI